MKLLDSQQPHSNFLSFKFEEEEILTKIENIPKMASQISFNNFNQIKDTDK